MRMRKLLLIIVAFMATIGASADGLNVVSFKLLETDLTANTRGTERRDQNGDKAALIKIVSPEKGFHFDGGSLGIVGTEQKAAELWLYVPPRAQKLTISHPVFGMLRDYYYPVSIQGGRTYEMLLDIGTGRYATITTSMARSLVYVDGENLGRAPIYNKYLNFGRHIVTASNDRFEGADTIYIMPNDEKKTNVFNVEMHNISHLFGDVKVTVDNKADIYFEGSLVGTGSWSTQLREGSYTVETRKADCDSVKSTFEVKRQQLNEFKAAPPIPHSGFLNIVTFPVTTTALLDGKSMMVAGETVTLPVGPHEISYSLRGYVPETRAYDVLHNETVADTVNMVPISYVRPSAFYFGGGINVRSLGGFTGILGMVLGNNDFQVSYTFGNTESKVAYWTSNTGAADEINRITYKMNSIQVKYGYQIALMRRIGFVPQIGWSMNQLKGVQKAGTKMYGDGASQQALTIGAKLLFVPTQHVYLFAAPELGIGLKADETFNKIAEAAGFSTTTIGVQAGLILAF